MCLCSQLADMWTDSLEPTAYARFLTATIESVTHKDVHTGRVEWRSDRDCLSAYFRKIGSGSEHVETVDRCVWLLAREARTHECTATRV